MISVIMPLGQRQRPPQFWLARGVLYVLAATAGGAALGALMGLLGAALQPLVPLPLALALAVALAVAYGLHEARVWRLPHPERQWQVPNSWIVRRPLLGAVAFGLVIGAGVFTFIPFTSFYILLAWQALSGSPLVGALLGGVYGLARALPVVTGAVVTRRGGPIQPVHIRILEASPRIHRATSGMLLLAGVALMGPLALLLAPR
jgi:sulfite exporter TauE/SafE